MTASFLRSCTGFARPSRRARAAWGFVGPVALSAALFVALFAAAFVRPAAAASQDTAPAAATAPVEGLSSPRETLTTFLDGVVRWRESGDKADLARAVRALEMEAFPAADRGYLGQQFASRLLHLFDKVSIVDPTELPDDGAASSELASGVFTRTYSRADRPNVVLELQFKRVREGEWRIASTTLNRLADWTERYADVPALAELAKPATFQEWVRSTVPDTMRKRVAFLEAWQWIGMAVLVLVGLVAQRVVSFFFARFVLHLSRSERVALDAGLLARVARPLALMATSVSFFAGVPLLDLNPGAYHFVNLLANVGLTIAIVWTAYRVVDVIAWIMAQRAAQTEGKFDDMLVPLVRRTLKFVVIVLGVVLIVTRMDRDLWGLVAGLSIGSLAVGFAAKDSIENLFGTFTVLMDKPFQLGDFIVVNGIEGAVEDVGFRSTRLRTPEDSLVTVPNSRFIAAHVENRGMRRRLRVRTLLGLTYDTPPEKIEAFCEGVRELIRLHPYTRKADYNIWMVGFGASSLDLQLVFFFEVPDAATELRERHRLYLDILRLAERLGISFAFPTQTLQIERAPAARDHSDRPEAVAAAVERGRRAASEVAERSQAGLRGRRPPPVRFDTQSADDAGHGAFDD